MNIVIPIAGRAQRFLDAGYNMPKPLIMVKDRLMIDLAMSAIDWEGHKLIFVVRKDHIYSFAIDKILQQNFGKDIEIVTTDGITCGSVCTCLLAKKHINNTEPLLIYTPDVYFENRFDPNTIDKDCDGMILTFKANSNAHSYVQLDANDVAIKTAEKSVISENAAVGVYYFASGKRFVKKAEQMIDMKITVNNEYYICPIYNLFIEDESVVKIKQVEKMHVLGTPGELEFYINNVYPRFACKPIALCSDHSGFDCKEDCKEIFQKLGIEYIDFGTLTNKSCDYTDFASQAIHGIKNHLCDFGMGFCRTGQGINIAANKSDGIRSAIVFDEYTAEFSRRHNCANFFSIPSKYVDRKSLEEIIICLGSNSFDGGRHMTRLSKSGP